MQTKEDLTWKPEKKERMSLCVALNGSPLIFTHTFSTAATLLAGEEVEGGWEAVPEGSEAEAVVRG